MAISDNPSSDAPAPSQKPRLPPRSPGFYARTLVDGEHVKKTLIVKTDQCVQNVLFCRETSFSLQRLCTRTKILREVCFQYVFNHVVDVVSIEGPSGVDTLIALAENYAVTFLIYDIEDNIFVPTGHFELPDTSSPIALPIVAPRTLEVHPTRSLVLAAPLQGKLFVFPVLFLGNETSAGRILSHEFKGTLLGHTWPESGEELGEISLLALLVQVEETQFIELLAIGRDSIELMCVVATCSMRKGEDAVNRAAVQLLGDPPLRPSKACAIYSIPGVPYGITICLAGRLVVSNLQEVVGVWVAKRRSNLNNGTNPQEYGEEAFNEQSRGGSHSQALELDLIDVTTPPFIGFDLKSPSRVTTVAPCGDHLGATRGLYIALSSGELAMLRYGTEIRGLQVQLQNCTLDTQYQLESVGRVGRVISMISLSYNLLLICCDAADGGLWEVTPLDGGRVNTLVSASGQTSYRMRLMQDFLNLSPVTDIHLMGSQDSELKDVPLEINTSIPSMDFSSDTSPRDPKLIACCGIGQQGMLRIISKGCPLSDYSSSKVAFRYCNSIWNLKPSTRSKYDLLTVLGFTDTTGVLFPVPAEDNGQEEYEYIPGQQLKAAFLDASEASGFVLDQPTLAVGLVSEGVLAQVHRKGIRLIKLKQVTHGPHVVEEDGEQILSPIFDRKQDWLVPEGAAVSVGAVGSNIAVYVYTQEGSTAGICIVAFQNLASSEWQGSINRLFIDKQVSCLRVLNIDGGQLLMFGTYAASVDTMYIKNTSEARPVLQLTQPLRLQVNLAGAVPETILAIDHDGVTWIFVSMRNGFVYQYRLSRRDHGEYENFKLKPVSSRQLGVQPVRICPVNLTAGSGVLAIAERLWLGQIVNERLTWWPLALSWARAVAPLSLPGAEKCLTLVDEKDILCICGVHKRIPVSIRSIPVGGTPHRVTSLNISSGSSELIIVAVTLNDAQATSEDHAIISELRVYNSRTARLRARRRLKDGETVHVLQRFRHYVLVGTAFNIRDFRISGIPCKKGRLLLLSLTESPGDQESDGDDNESFLEFYVCSEVIFAGAVLAAATFGREGHLIVSCNEAILMFRLEPRCALIEIARASTRMLVVGISCCGPLICIADRKDSLGFYYFDESAGSLERNHGDFRKRIASDCVAISGRMAVAPDKFGNIFSLSCESFDDHSARGKESSSGNRYRKVVSNHAFGLGSVSVRLCHGSLRRHDFVETPPLSAAPDNHSGEKDSRVSEPSLSFEKDIIVGTLTGSILTLIPISAAELAMLSSIEKIMDCRMRTRPLVLGSTHEDFRSAYGAPPKGIVDGNFIEQFNKLEETLQLDIAASAGFPGRAMVESIRSLIVKLDARVY